MKFDSTNVILSVIAILAVIAGLYFLFRPEPVPVDLAVIERGELHVTVEGEGKTRVKEIYVVSAPVTGRILRVETHAGDPVIANESIVAVVQPADPSFLDVRGKAQAEADVQAAMAGKALADARLARAKAEHSFAESDLYRYRRLAAGGHISQRDLERAELDVHTRKAEVATAVAAVQQADFALAKAQAALMQPGQASSDDADCCVQVRSPAAGQVLRVLSESEAVVIAGQPIMEVGDPHDLEIVVDLLSTDAVQVREGAEVLIEHWGGAEVLHGRVRLVEPSGFTKISALGIEEQRVNVIIDFVDPPDSWRSLGDGFRVETRIVVWAGADELKVPVSALFRHANRWAVFAVADGRARLLYVDIGRRNDLEAQVIEGLTAGDMVIVHPSDRIEDGGRVELRAAEGG